MLMDHGVIALMWEFDTSNDLQAGEQVGQKNEGKWKFSLREVGNKIVLDVDLGQGVLTSEIRGEVHPGLVRMLVKVPPPPTTTHARHTHHYI
jgi:hypothetical protein